MTPILLRIFRAEDYDMVTREVLDSHTVELFMRYVFVSSSEKAASPRDPVSAACNPQLLLEPVKVELLKVTAGV